MESGSELFSRIPELTPQQRVETYFDLTKSIGNILSSKIWYAPDFFVPAAETKGITTRDIEFTGGRYRIIRNLGSSFCEIQIQRNSLRIDNPNIALEEIRFKVGRPEASDAVPDIAYNRVLRTGGSRTLTNNILAIRKVEKFIAVMAQNVRS